MSVLNGIGPALRCDRRPAGENQYALYRANFGTWVRLHLSMSQHHLTERERDSRDTAVAVLEGFERMYEFDERRLQEIMDGEIKRFDPSGTARITLPWRKGS